jgi:sugar phosphate isomerase/epimerase
MPLGYCTNVHAGTSLAETRAQLERHALGVKSRFSPGESMGLGLWLSASSVSDLLRTPDVLHEFRDWLASVGLVPFTLNGFPYGDFHQPVVKHRVYEPRWDETTRLDYTLHLITALDAFLPPGLVGSISTLPIRWPEPKSTDSERANTIRHLRRVAARLAELEESGRSITVCLEPEPGCLLETSAQVVRFFEGELIAGGGLLEQGNEEQIRRYLAICHDVCHAAVMFEDQRDVLKRYSDAGLRVGKVQVSSAVVVESAGEAELEQLASFAEDRYLHQTCVGSLDSKTPPQFFEDLPLALQAVRDGDTSLLGRPWRVHFHVPVYLERFGHLGTSREAIRECLKAALEFHPQCDHYEVETYAWGVLPESLKRQELAEGIAEEMAFVSREMEVHR